MEKVYVLIRGWVGERGKGPGLNTELGGMIRSAGNERRTGKMSPTPPQANDVREDGAWIPDPESQHHEFEILGGTIGSSL